MIKERNNKRLMLVKYNKTNETFSSKLEIGVNGHQGVFLDGVWCVAPWFLIKQAQSIYHLNHRERPAKENNDTYESFKVYSNMETRELESQDPAEVLAWIAKVSKDRNSEYYRVYACTKNFHFGDLSPKESEAELGTGLDMGQNEVKALLAKQKVEMELQEVKHAEELKARDAKMDKLTEMMEKLMASSSESIKAPAMTPAEKAKATKARNKAKAEEEAKELAEAIKNDDDEIIAPD